MKNLDIFDISSCCHEFGDWSSLKFCSQLSHHSELFLDTNFCKSSTCSVKDLEDYSVIANLHDEQFGSKEEVSTIEDHQHLVEHQTIKTQEVWDQPLGYKKKKRGRKPIKTGLTKRKDVVLKALVRKVRKFHIKRLKEVTDFKTVFQCGTQQLHQFIKTYIEKEFWMEPNIDFINTWEWFMFLDSSNNNIFRDALYKYSLPKLQRLLENQYFRSLLYHYSFEADENELDKNTLIALEMIKRKEDFW